MPRPRFPVKGRGGCPPCCPRNPGFPAGYGSGRSGAATAVEPGRFGVVGPGGDPRAQHGQGLAGLAGPGQQEGQGVGVARVVGAQATGLPGETQGILGVGRGQQHAEVVGGLGQAGIGPKRRAQMFFRAGRVVFLGQQQAQVEVGRGVVRGQAQGLGQGLLGRLGLVQAAQGDGQVDQLGHGGRVQEPGLFVVPHGRRRIALAEGVVAQVVLRGPQVRPGRKRSQKFRGGPVHGRKRSRVEGLARHPGQPPPPTRTSGSRRAQSRTRPPSLGRGAIGERSAAPPAPGARGPRRRGTIAGLAPVGTGPQQAQEEAA